jgi:hypothetical protein
MKINILIIKISISKSLKLILYTTQYQHYQNSLDYKALPNS